jgi:hypothetical protein
MVGQKKFSMGANRPPQHASANAAATMFILNTMGNTTILPTFWTTMSIKDMAVALSQ